MTPLEYSAFFDSASKEYAKKCDVNAWPRVNLRVEVAKAKNWVQAKPPSERKKDIAGFLRRWFDRAESNADKFSRGLGGAAPIDRVSFNPAAHTLQPMSPERKSQMDEMIAEGHEAARRARLGLPPLREPTDTDAELDRLIKEAEEEQYADR